MTRHALIAKPDERAVDIPTWRIMGFESGALPLDGAAAGVDVAMPNASPFLPPMVSSGCSIVIASSVNVPPSLDQSLHRGTLLTTMANGDSRLIASSIRCAAPHIDAVATRAPVSGHDAAKLHRHRAGEYLGSATAAWPEIALLRWPENPPPLTIPIYRSS